LFLPQNNPLLPEPLNFLSNCRFYFQATGNAFTSRQFSLEAPRRFVVGCTCCNVAASAPYTRELSSGNVVIMRHSVGGHLANCSYIRASFQRPGPTRLRRPGFPESCEVVRDAETAIFSLSLFFFLDRERSAPGARSTDGKSFFHRAVRGAPESMTSGCA
jgi:hypothetical protein